MTCSPPPLRSFSKTSRLYCYLRLLAPSWTDDAEVMVWIPPQLGSLERTARHLQCRPLPLGNRQPAHQQSLRDVGRKPQPRPYLPSQEESGPIQLFRG